MKKTRFGQARWLAGIAIAIVLLTCPLRDSAPAVKAAAPQFRDVTGRSVLTYISRNDYRGRKYFIQPMCGGVGILDYDGDGRSDIFLTNGAELPSLRKTPGFYNCLLRNRGDGSFEDRTIAAGLQGRGLGYNFGVAVGDYDNDGRGDLFVTGAPRNTLYRNHGGGRFADVTANSGLDVKPADLLSVAAAWFDYDNDGLLDLFVANYTTWTPAEDKRCTNPGDIQIYCGPTMYPSVPNTLYRNLGRGRFEDVTVKSGLASSLGRGMGVSVADFNGDGWQDVFVANDAERNFLFMNRGDGTFKEEALFQGVALNDDGIAVNGMGSDAKDFDNDGFVDIFYNDLANQVFALFRNERGKSFRYVSLLTGIGRISRPFSGWSAGFIDYDNDGWKDIYSANGHVDDVGPNTKQHDTMFRNDAGKIFRDVSAEMGDGFEKLGYHRGSAFEDFNGDGSLDIVVTGLNERPRILLNTPVQGNHWLLLELVGTASNRDAVGASVTVTTSSGPALRNHVSVSTGFLSSSGRRVHFGLGSNQAAKTVEIRWPSGAVQTLTNIHADTIVKIEEPR